MPSFPYKPLIVSILLLSVPLVAACDNDQPQTPQKESSLEPDALTVAAIEPAAGEVDESALPNAGVAQSPAADSAIGSDVVPQDDLGGNAGPEGTVLPDEIPAADIPPPPSRAVFNDASCDFESWVGKPLDEAAIKKLNRPTRIMKPGDMMTMDHSPMRVNVEHEGDKVTRVWCG